MKLIIDIPEEMHNDIKSGKDGYSNYVHTAIRHGTPIPDNATNGEVLKTMFMPNRITRTSDIVHIEYDFTPEWWNSPYKKGGNK